MTPSTLPCFGQLQESFTEESIRVLRKRLNDSGYLLIRNFHRAEVVNRAGNLVRAYISENEQPSTNGYAYTGFKPLTHHPLMLQVLESRNLYEFFEALYDEPAQSFDFKWLRAQGRQATAVHLDRVYVGSGSERLLSVWTPLMNVSINQAPLYLIEDSHQAASYQKIRDTYGLHDVDRDLIDGRLSDDPEELIEKYGKGILCSSYNAGDILIFGMNMLHGSFPNQTNDVRISCDCRFQPLSEAMDSRWSGENPMGHYAWIDGVPRKSMEACRAEWGI